MDYKLRGRSGFDESLAEKINPKFPLRRVWAGDPIGAPEMMKQILGRVYSSDGEDLKHEPKQHDQAKKAQMVFQWSSPFLQIHGEVSGLDQSGRIIYHEGSTNTRGISVPFRLARSYAPRE